VYRLLVVFHGRLLFTGAKNVSAWGGEIRLLYSFFFSASEFTEYLHAERLFIAFMVAFCNLKKGKAPPGEGDPNASLLRVQTGA
jgi:hypothetical protein